MRKNEKKTKAQKEKKKKFNRKLFFFFFFPFFNGTETYDEKGQTPLNAAVARHDLAAIGTFFLYLGINVGF
jgi:hypothetical protein